MVKGELWDERPAAGQMPIKHMPVHQEPAGVNDKADETRAHPSLQLGNSQQSQHTGCWTPGTMGEEQLESSWHQRVIETNQLESAWCMADSEGGS